MYILYSSVFTINQSQDSFNKTLLSEAATIPYKFDLISSFPKFVNEHAFPHNTQSFPIQINLSSFLVNLPICLTFSLEWRNHFPLCHKRLCNNSLPRFLWLTFRFKNLKSQKDSLFFYLCSLSSGITKG